MRSDSTPPTLISGRRGHARLLAATTVVAAGAAAARWADGSPMLPGWACAGLQLPAIGLWIAVRCAAPKRPGGAPPTRAQATTDSRTTLDLVLTIAVLGVGSIASMRRGEIGPFLTAGTLFIAGVQLLEHVLSLIRRVEARLEEPARLFGMMARQWIVLVVAVTILLALPIATRSAVPDYRHNFWQHVVNSAFASVSGACLVGSTIYSFRDDYSRFGQIVLLLTTHLAGVGMAALGLSMVQPFLRRRVELRTVLRWMFLLMGIGVLVTMHAWTGEESPSLAARLGWSFVYVSDALFNTGFVLRPDGLAGHLRHGTVFVAITALAIVGSLGLPIVIDLVRGSRREPAITRDAGRQERDPRAVVQARPVLPPWKVLPAYEAGACFWLLIVGAVLLCVFETPGYLPERGLHERPVDLGENLVALRDPMSHQARWSMAMFVSATLRSAGIQSIPLVPGAISLPSIDVLIAWMAIGGSIGGTAGGLRTTTLMFLVLCLWSRRKTWGSLRDGRELRHDLMKTLHIGIAAWVGIGGVLLFVLSRATQASTHEWLIDAAAAYCGVSLSSGVTVHLTAGGRLAMIVLMLAGSTVPLLCWSNISSKLRVAMQNAAPPVGK